jgi:hypothetical protein
MEDAMQFKDRKPELISVGLFVIGISFTIAFAMFVGLLYRGPGEIAEYRDRGANTEPYRDSGIFAPAKPNG